MRVELFVKDSASLAASSRFLFATGARGINLPNKASATSVPELAPLAALRTLSQALSPEELAEVCPHYSLKFNSAGANADATLQRFEDFCAEAARLKVRQCLLVTGSGNRKFDSVECLKALRLPPEERPEIGVAFNPFFPERALRQRERARLRLKLGTGAVTSVWLQIGSDISLLNEALDFIDELKDERNLPNLKLYGSIFMPSKRLLAQMKFRPWNGVFLSDEYLSSVEAAKDITQKVLERYAKHGVEVLLETSINKPEDWAAALELCSLALTSDSNPPTEIVSELKSFEHSGTGCGAGNSPASSDALAKAPRNKRPRHADERARESVLPKVDTVEATDAAMVTASSAPAPAVCPPALLHNFQVVSLVWFRNFDLRLADHAPLLNASRQGMVVPCFVWPRTRGKWSLGGAAEAWLKDSLASLDGDLREEYRSRLILRSAPSARLSGDEAMAADCMRVAKAASLAVPLQKGANSAAAVEEAMMTAAELLLLARECGATAIRWHRCYEPEGARVDAVVEKAIREAGLQGGSVAGHLLYEPKGVSLPGGFHGGHWGTLMPFLKACERSGKPPARPAASPAKLCVPPKWPRCSTLSELELANRPVREDGKLGWDWGASVMKHWIASEKEAVRRMHTFLSGPGLRSYESRRSRADIADSVSTLSPYLRFGQLSVRQLYHAIRGTGMPREDIKTFSRRLHWRDLAAFQLSCFPEMAWKPIRAHYSSHGWSTDETALHAWQRGRTGYPIVDAGMRCLWATGWMHQSVRMVVASFLVEYLGISWVEGLHWFHDTLVDADLSINSMMWQNAGRSGIDQWNFVLSPETGSQDPTGEYVRRWIPELANLPNKHIHTPWKAPPAVLSAAGVELGVTYPERIVANLDDARSITVARLLKMRSEALEYNDAGGYDLVTLPDGKQTRVFTKQEFRLTGDGRPKTSPPASIYRGRGAGRGSKAGRGRGATRKDKDDGLYSIKKYMR